MTKPPQIQQILGFAAEAPKIRGEGNIRYQLWVDASGGLYVQFEENDETGSFPGLLFSVAEFAPECIKTTSIPPPEGYDVVTEKSRVSKDKNASGFLKAVLRHLLPLDK